MISTATCGQGLRRPRRAHVLISSVASTIQRRDRFYICELQANAYAECIGHWFDYHSDSTLSTITVCCNSIRTKTPKRRMSDPPFDAIECAMSTDCHLSSIGITFSLAVGRLVAGWLHAAHWHHCYLLVKMALCALVHCLCMRARRAQYGCNNARKLPKRSPSDREGEREYRNRYPDPLGTHSVTIYLFATSHSVSSPRQHHRASFSFFLGDLASAKSGKNAKRRAREGERVRQERRIHVSGFGSKYAVHSRSNWKHKYLLKAIAHCSNRHTAARYCVHQFYPLEHFAAVCTGASERARARVSV